MVEAIKLKTQS